MDGGEQLAKKLVQARSPEDAVRTTLRTSNRVMSRITDGIYRQPGSALRELLANAYDADATRVTVLTDRPRFRTIRVEDDGNGMSPEIIGYVLQNIGGSPKRVTVGSELGVTSPDDRNRSPGGRPLIGKIGIGLFSVSQLAKSFKIVTKQSGDKYYSIVQFLLKHYADDGQEDEAGEYEAGLALLWQEEAEEKEAHGTTVVLDPVRPEAMHLLRSSDEWRMIDAQDGSQRRHPPTYHIGRLRKDSDDHFASEPSEAHALPWDRNDEPTVAFAKFVRAVEEKAGSSQNNTKLEGLCDRYLRMVWDLALALPLPYVEVDPLFSPLGNSFLAYRLEGGTVIPLNEGGGALETTLAIELGVGDTVDHRDSFHVSLDNLKLARPLTFSGFPSTQRARQEPLLLCQKVAETFEGSSRELSGGPLSFLAYLVWAPKLAPRDRGGALIRIHGASGTGFDDGFLRYQTRENVRLGQTTCEIFVTEGLEGALNIDRESFNYAHPHVVYLSKWLHGALTSLFTEEKKLSSKVRKRKRTSQRAAKEQALHNIAEEAWQQEGYVDEELPTIAFLDEEAQTTDEDPLDSLKADSYSISRPRLSDAMPGVSPGPLSNTTELEAIFQILAAFGLLDLLDEPERQRLATALAGVVEVAKGAG